MERVTKDKETAKLLGLIRVRVWRSEIIEDNIPMSPIQANGFDDVDGQLAEYYLSKPFWTDKFSSSWTWLRAIFVFRKARPPLLCLC